MPLRPVQLPGNAPAVTPGVSQLFVIAPFSLVTVFPILPLVSAAIDPGVPASFTHFSSAAEELAPALSAAFLHLTNKPTFTLASFSTNHLTLCRHAHTSLSY